MLGFYVWPLFCSVVLSVLFSFCNYFAKERGSRYFVLIMFLLLCGCQCPVPLPLCAKGWSVIFDCDISWSYSLDFSQTVKMKLLFY